MDLREAMEHKVQTLRILAADSLRGHRVFRGGKTGPCRELADWYEGRYLAFKFAAETVRGTLETYG